MVARLILFMLGYLLMIGAPTAAAGYVVYRALGPWRKRRHARLVAAEHAKLLKESEDQRCFYCLEHCDERDCYENGKGWYHVACMKALLG